MKKILSLILILTGFASYSQILDINNLADPESGFSLQQLVENVLISGDCADVDNFTSQVSGSANQTYTKSYGYFKKPTGSNFAFDEGLIITSGRAYSAGNTVNNDSPFPDFINGTPGDNDLETALGIINTYDATFIKFQFTPISSDFSFNFIMASEEYDGYFECDYSDSFAFLLREVGTTTYTNLAVLPDNTPVSVTNINNSNGCPSNVTYFEGYDLPHTNYGGQTKVLTASATVTPFQTYEIKLVVADQGDPLYDSAIFLEAGGFNLGLDLGEDLSISTGNPACSNNAVILNTHIPTSFAPHTWYLNDVEIDGETNSTLTVVENGTYSVLIDNGSSCVATDSIIIEFTTSPVANPVSDQLICDDNNDGFWDFNMLALSNVVLGTQHATQFSVSFHTNLTDANTNSNSLPNNYTNQVAYQAETIYVRIESNVNPDCYETTSFVIDVFDMPTTIPVLYDQCDNNDDGDDTNGYAKFDLNTISPQIYDTQDPTQFNISYHLNQTDANNNASPLSLIYTNTSAFQQDIVVRLENIDHPDCYATSAINLVVYPMPSIIPSVTLEQCDDNLDGLTLFNLNEANTLISNNSDNETFTYYLTEAQAISGLVSDQITNVTAYTNLNPFNDIVFSRIESSPDCFKTSRIDLEVVATQIPASFQLTYEVCDDTLIDGDNTNGIASFDFSDATAQIEALFPAGQPIEITYYTNMADALSEENTILDISNHRNEASPFTQNIYVRIDSENANACLGLGEHITLTVDALPLLNPISNYELCSDTNEATFDLTLKDNEVIGSQTTPMLISYFESLVDANNNLNPIVGPYLNNTTPRTIYVRAQFDDNNNGIGDPDECYSTEMSFNLIVNPNPILIQPAPIIICNNQVETEYDLTIRKDEITGNDASINLVYYESQLDVDNTNPISNPSAYLNTVLDKEIVVVATGPKGCKSQTILTLNTVIYANLNLAPSPIEECEIDNDGYDSFDITRQELSILNGLNAADFVISYYENELDAIEGNSNTINTPLDFTNTVPVSQIIYVRVTPTSNNCAQIVPLTLIVNPVPEIALENKYVICLDANSQVINPMTETVLPNPPIETHLSDTEYNFQWYEGEEVDATNMIIGATQSAFSPTTTGYYTVNATNISTGCNIPGTTQVVGSYPPESITAEVVSESFTKNNTIEVSIIGNGNYLISLDYGLWQSTTTFQNIDGGEHIIRVRDTYNCNELIYEITVIDYPKFFTPNNDGHNDTWNLYGMSNKLDAKIFIYDRYGKLLKQINPNGIGWDGTYNGEPLSSNDYWFTIEYTEPTNSVRKTFKAHFTLKR
ncbi:T9SS type B sorting domain-containing protein [Xanthomarina sp. F2636L]|uniref:T9SS type B sorting domain-containing protein n=1 Tax=Xanthomarina sp. F2636L TaxID=2996018 RepID=UPI00225DE12B|nr:choice-of-anchor L domain-containing protein [Xanthomarina sp. F2636L]MCX7552152.1 choice-of-anchor L domain-containing protein [Xanthomarina sp. F2636L]